MAEDRAMPTAGLSIMLRTSDYRGDHAADVVLVFAPIAGETVEALATRVFAERAKGLSGRGDYIELRQIVRRGEGDDE